MSRSLLRRWLPAVALVLVACTEGGPADPMEALDLLEDQPLASVLPDLAAEPGTAATDRYVPTLERAFRHAVGVVRERRGDDSAAEIMARLRGLRDEVLAARGTDDAAAFREAVHRLEAFEAQIALRVFGPSLVRHVAQDAGRKLSAVAERLRAAHEAGRDVSRLVPVLREAEAHLKAARTAAETDRGPAALIHAAKALDLVLRLGASFD